MTEPKPGDVYHIASADNQDSFAYYIVVEVDEQGPCATLHLLFANSSEINWIAVWRPAVYNLRSSTSVTGHVLTPINQEM